MAISKSEALVGVIIVIRNRTGFTNVVATDTLRTNPRLGFSSAGVGALAPFLRQQFSVHNLNLTPAVIERLSPSIVRDLRDIVVRRSTPVTKAQVKTAVIKVIKGLYGFPSVSETQALGSGSLGLTKTKIGKLAAPIRMELDPFVGINYNRNDAKGATTVKDMINDVFARV